MRRKLEEIGRRGRRSRTSAPANPFADDADWILGLDAALSTRDADTVGQINDLSGRGYHAVSTLTARPVWNATAIGGAYPGLVFDGVNDRLDTPALAALATKQGVTVFLVMKDASNDTVQILDHGSGGGTTAGSFALIGNIGVFGSLSFYVCGNAGFNFQRTNADTEALLTHKVISCSADFAAAGAAETAAIRSNAANLAGAQTGTNNNTGAFISRTLTIGASNAGFSNQALTLGALYIVGRSMTAAEKLPYERYLGGRFGLPFDEVAAAGTPIRIGVRGQSNAMGQTGTQTTILAYGGPHIAPRIRAYKDYDALGTRAVTGWGPLQANPVTGWVGPDAVICSELLDLGFAPEMIMTAKGATALWNNWNPAIAGDMFDRSEATWDTALATHPEPLDNPPTWCVFIQGESDAPGGGQAQYGDRLTAFMSATRARFVGAANTKFVIWKLHPDNSMGTPEAVALIRAGQDAACAADVIGAFTIESAGKALQADFVHLTQEAVIAMSQETAALIAANT
jgi:hypothetical protein